MRLNRRMRSPTILQLEATECGSASLAIVLGFHGRRVPLEELRLVCGVSRDGSKASSILKAARSYGLSAKGLKAEPEHLDTLQLPVIAFVHFCHFLVVEAINGRRVFLNDPANGRYSVTREEFDDMFTGVVLVFEPEPEFERKDTRPSVAASLLRRTKGFRLATSYVVLVSLALVLPGIAVPAFSRAFIDYVVIRDLDSWLAPLIAGMVLTAIARFLLNELRNWHLARAETRLAINGAQELFGHILRLPIQFFGARYAGEVSSRLQLSDGLANLLTGQLAQAVLSLVTAAFFFAIMLLYSVHLSLTVLALSLVNIAVLLAISRQASEGYRKLSIQRGKLGGVGLSGIQDIETYKAAGSEDLFFSRWTGLHAGITQTHQAMSGKLALLGIAPTLITSVTTAAILVLGGRAIMNGSMGIGSLVAFQTLAASFTSPFIALMGLAASLQEVRSFTERIDDVLLQDPDRHFDQTAHAHTKGRLPLGQVTLDAVSFGYLPLEPPLISKLDLDVKAGGSVALVGASGSGKSTVGRILAGLFSPSEGQLLLDGSPLASWPRSVLSNSLAYVDQNIVLFEGTVRENLTLWDRMVPDHEIVAAAQDAMIHDVISERPGGYNAMIEEGGRNLSGGQRQRIEIARALVSNPRVLVLDEATSALDTVTEAAIMQNLKHRGCTLIMIAHRLSTIRECDEIVVFDRGRVAERGTHEALLARRDYYADLVQA
jgi:NHLM bacteriocin system ABC transporter peptidase/ATP-binding protein